MAKKNKNKKSGAKYRRARLLFAAVVMALAVYFGYSIIRSSVQIREEKAKLAVLQEEVERQQLLNDELQRLLDDGDTSQQMERIARERLGYAKPGERLYVDAAG